MSDDLMSLFDGLDRLDAPKKKDVIVQAPFAYPGGKRRAIKQILPHLPYENTYVEPFGGSGTILLARNPSTLEVFNTRYAGVTAFYRCLRNPDLLNALMDWLERTVHSREEFVWCKDSWEDATDPVERAARWYFMMETSFSSLGRNWGRSTKGFGSMPAKLKNKLKFFPEVHERLRGVQIENQDWKFCLQDYDSPETVFYLDPPYLDVYSGTYKHEMTEEDHEDMLNRIFDLEGFVALSGYANKMYDDRKWDDRLEWKAFVSIKSQAYTEGNNKAHLENVGGREHSTEILWIKESK